jgi:deoxyribodipyrimidine photo-lyase
VTPALVLYTRDLRVHDHEGLAEAARAHDRVVPVFVLDDHLLNPRAANRLSFLLDSLADLRRSLREHGSDLVVRRGDPVVETARLARQVGATHVFAARDASAYAQRRARRLERELARERVELRLTDTIPVVPSGKLAPQAGDHYRIFTPYWRRWRELPLRPLYSAPKRLPPLGAVEPGELPSLDDVTSRAPARALPAGGESAGRRRLSAWLRDGIARYGETRNRLEPGATSALSPYLRFGCVSPVEVVYRARERGGSGAEELVRQLCWRDFFLQLLAANPRLRHENLQARDAPWRDDPASLAAWGEGRTGYPIVDAAMRQLAREGWLPNRARLIVSSFLTRALGLDWRLGADVFFELLVDGDVASNVGNWQWVAGTGADPRRRPGLSVLRQARRFDPDGAYVRRYLPELEGLQGAGAHEPWRAKPSFLRGYPPPIVDPEQGSIQS